MHECVPEVYAKVSIHLVWNRGFFQMDCSNSEVFETMLQMDSIKIDCSDFTLPESELTKFRESEKSEASRMIVLKRLFFKVFSPEDLFYSIHFLGLFLGLI